MKLGGPRPPKHDWTGPRDAGAELYEALLAELQALPLSAQLALWRAWKNNGDWAELPEAVKLVFRRLAR